MLPECSNSSISGLRNPRLFFSRRPAFWRSLSVGMAGSVRFLLVALIATAIAAPPGPWVAALEAELPHHPAHRLPHQHRPTPSVAKIRSADTVAVRLSARSFPEPKSRTAQRAASPSSCLSTTGHCPGHPASNRVFRPLRC